MPTLIKKKSKKPSTPSFGTMAKDFKKVPTMFRPMVRSRHPSHDVLRKGLSLLPFRSIIRLGSTTDRIDTVTNGGTRIECNTIEAIKNSASKFKMKQRFKAGNVSTASFILGSSEIVLVSEGIQERGHPTSLLQWPIVAKKEFGSRGEGMWLLENKADWDKFMELNRSRLNDYLFEKYHNYNREYRLHVTGSECFYACRKMLKEGTEERWFRNDSNCIWVIDTNPVFEKPTNWKQIEEECIKALKSVGLDVGACDVRVQSKSNPKFFIVEINSAPSFGEITAKKYLDIIPKVLKAKHSNGQNSRNR